VLVQVSDERLIEASRSGEQAAFDEIVGRYEGLLLRHCTRVVGEAQAQDAVQETLLTAWTALRAGVEVRALRPWLFTIAHRRALATLRDRRQRWSELPESLTDGASSADAAERSARVHDALAALAELPDDQREALLSSAVHGRSGREIARTLDVDEASVRQLIHRARTSLRSAAAACFVPPLLILRAARHAGRSLRRVALSADPVQFDAGSKLAKAGVAAIAIAVAVAGTGALQLASPAKHAPPARHASAPLAATPAPAVARSAAAHGESKASVRGAAGTNEPLATPPAAGSTTAGSQTTTSGGGPQPGASSGSAPSQPLDATAPGSVTSGASGAAGVIESGASGVVGSVTNTVTGTVGAVSTATQQIVKNTVTPILTTATHTVQTVTQDAATGTQGVTTSATNAVQGVTNTVTSGVQSVTTGVTGLLGVVSGG